MMHMMILTRTIRFRLVPFFMFCVLIAMTIKTMNISRFIKSERSDVPHPVNLFAHRSTLSNDLSRNLNEMKMSSLELDMIYPVKDRLSDTSLVLYNRVPKCASSTMIWLISRLKKEKGFNMVDVNLPQIKQFMDKSIQIELMDHISASPPDTFYIRHVHFLDFEKSVADWPVYVNVIRDPVERFISHYYFMRFGFKKGGGSTKNKWFPSMSDEKRNMTVEECVLKGAKWCVESNAGTFLSFFCGQEADCRHYSDYSLQKAKINLVKYYAVVGLVEDLNNTVAVLSALLPRYFSKDLKIEPNLSVKETTKTFNRLDPPDHVKAMLRDALKVEVEFYEFVKMRFYKQLKLLRL